MMRKTSYAILMTPAMVFNVLILLLASYATYIYAAIVIFIGFMLIYAKSINKFVRRCVRSHKSNGEIGSVGTLDKSVA